MADDTGEIGREAAEAANFGNIKTVGEATAFYTQLGFQQALNANQGWVSINQAIVAKASEFIMNSSAQDTAGEAAILGQIGKLLQMMPPPTNLPTQGQ